jgi:crossover junction endodeoxyribonuclease RusA
VATFEFVVEGPPVSLRAKDKNARRYQRWIRTVREAARAQWPAGLKPATSPVEVTISNFFTLVPPDVDNIIKPILDALESVAYVDDVLVHRVTSSKIDLSAEPMISNPSPCLAAALENWSEVVYVTVVWE